MPWVTIRIMRMYFTFAYDALDKVAFAVEESTGSYAPLVECTADLIQKWGLWPSFVQQYRDSRQTVQEQTESLGEEGGAKWVMKPPPEPGETQLWGWYDDISWGPTAAFDAEEAKAWAARWIFILDLMSDADAHSVFPLTEDLHEKTGPYGRENLIKDLQRLILQAECAKGHTVKLTMTMHWE